MPQDTCARQSCSKPLGRSHYRIFNEPSVKDGFNEYCVSCGRQILEESDLKYEVVRPMTPKQEVAMAERLGYTATKDARRGTEWCMFSSGDIHVWITQKGWARARLAEGRYRGHQYFDSLERALTGKEGDKCVL